MADDIKRYYFEDLGALMELLASKPTGKLRILVGTDGNPEDIPNALFVTAAINVSVAQWLIAKIDSGELEISASGKRDLPQGIELGSIEP